MDDVVVACDVDMIMMMIIIVIIMIFIIIIIIHTVQHRYLFVNCLYHLRTTLYHIAITYTT